MAQLTDRANNADKARAPKFSYTSDGDTGVITTAPADTAPRAAHDPTVWDDVLEQAGLDPAEVRVIPPVQVRTWDAAIGNGHVQRMYYYKVNVEHRTPDLDISAALRNAKRAAFVPKAAAAQADAAYVVALGDLQLGKALADETPVRTTEGWMPHGQLRPGHQVYSPVTGRPVKVLANTGSSRQQLFTVRLADGSSLEATAQHGFTGNYADEFRATDRPTPHMQTVEQIMAAHRARGAFRLIRSAPVQLGVMPIDARGLTDTEMVLGQPRGHSQLIPDARVLDDILAHRDARRALLTEFLIAVSENKPEAVDNLHCDEYGRLSDKARFYALAARLEGFRPTFDYSLAEDQEEANHPADDTSNTAGRLAFAWLEHDNAHTEALNPEYGSTLDIVSITGGLYSGAQCITVEGGLYLAGEAMIPTHNCDGDGVEGTVQRFLEKTRRAVEQYVSTSRGAPVHIVHLGDCIEGFVSQGGANTFRTTLTLTEQVDLYEQLLLEQITLFADVAPSVTVTGVPGNHDEANRPIHKYSDSWAIQALKSLERALSPSVNPNFSHVHFQYPGDDELVVVFDIAGLKVAAAHGHKFPRGADGYMKWWEKQSFGNQPVAEAKLLLAGHKHHLLVVEPTLGRMFMQVPSLESDSAWFRHAAGVSGSPGLVTFRVVGGQLPGNWSKL